MCGHAYDPAGLLDAPARERLAGYHAVLLRDLDIHFKAVFLAGRSGDIDRIAVELFDRYRLGARTRAARGVLLVVDPAGQQVRLEIGYDLEGVFPDGFVGRVEEEQMVPFFAAGRIGAGVAATVELLVARALEAGGTSFDSLYVNINGESGYFSRSLNAYGRAGEACPRCEAEGRDGVIVREQFMNRSSYRCAVCQRRPRRVRY